MKIDFLKNRKIIATVGFAFGVMILLGLGILVGVSGYSKLSPYFGKLGIFEGTVKTNDTLKVTFEESVIINVVENAMDSVVSIALSQQELKQGQGVVQQDSKIGTGFIVDSSGLIVTNQHVVSISDRDYKVITSKGESYDVAEITIDDVNDIALLKVEAQDLKPLTLGNSDYLKAGQLVIAIGTPLGEYAGSVTTGVISGLNRSVETGTGSFFGSTSKQYEDVIQTDAAINPGNSGGPLLNSSGEVIGVNFATTSGADNISFALPVNRVRERLDEYRKYGKFIQAYLGVEYEVISEYWALYYDNLVAGARVVRVMPNSPASKSGIKTGDIITKIGDDKITSSLSSVVQKHKVGEDVSVTIWRNGKTLTFDVNLEEAS